MAVYPIIMSQSKFVHRDTLQYPYEERGLQFGDGVYEVIRIYNGKYYLLTEHIERLFRSLTAIKINLSFTKKEVINLLNNLLSKNSMVNDGIVYLQVTRGSAPRNHLFPKNTKPNFYAYVKDAARDLNKIEHGVSTITLPDTRWKYCYIKSLNLLPNILAKQEADDNDCHEAILYTEDKTVTECSASNVYLVKNKKIYTHPATESVLHGCVRLVVEKFAKELNIPFIEQSFTTDDIDSAEELFLTSSSSEIMPIIKVNNKHVGNGLPGPISKQLQQAYEIDAQITTQIQNDII